MMNNARIILLGAQELTPRRAACRSRRRSRGRRRKGRRRRVTNVGWGEGWRKKRGSRDGALNQPMILQR